MTDTAFDPKSLLETVRSVFEPAAGSLKQTASTVASSTPRAVEAGQQFPANPPTRA